VYLIITYQYAFHDELLLKQLKVYTLFKIGKILHRPLEEQHFLFFKKKNTIILLYNNIMSGDSFATSNDCRSVAVTRLPSRFVADLSLLNETDQTLLESKRNELLQVNNICFLLKGVGNRYVYSGTKKMNFLI
jgi:hypothetical protein